MNTTDPYQRSAEVMQEKALSFIKEQIKKGMSLDNIITAIENGITSCNRKLKRDSFNVEQLGKKYELESKLAAANYIKNNTH